MFLSPLSLFKIFDLLFPNKIMNIFLFVVKNITIERNVNVLPQSYFLHTKSTFRSFKFNNIFSLTFRMDIFLYDYRSNILSISKVNSHKEGQGVVRPPLYNKLRYSSCSINFSFATNFSFSL